MLDAHDRGGVERGPGHVHGDGARECVGSAIRSRTAALATATFTPQNLNGETLMVMSQLLTANGTSAILTTGAQGSSTWYGLPASLAASSDTYVVFATAMGSGTLPPTRNVIMGSSSVQNLTGTFGPALNTPRIAIAGTSPYVRPRATLTTQAEYGDWFTTDFQQGDGANYRDVQIQKTGAYNSGAGTITFELPDFSGVSGWNNDWGLKGGRADHVAGERDRCGQRGGQQLRRGRACGRGVQGRQPTGSDYTVEMSAGPGQPHDRARRARNSHGRRA